MQVIRGLHNLRAEHRGCVATIGNFDGVHLGHQAVFGHLREKALRFGLPATVITFEPQSQEFFTPQKAPARLTRLREKLHAIKNTGIDRVVLLEFNQKLAAMSAEQFVQRLLVDGLGIRYLFVGDDFRFGRKRAGDIALLRTVGEKQLFEVENMNSFVVGDERVSSTRIRELLANDDLHLAAHFLGRPYRICGRVAHGDARGRTIGFPTANINLHRKVSPLNGVYAVSVYGLHEASAPGVANIGTRPTVKGDRRYLLEVHLFDFEQDIYGAHVEVEFRLKLRDEKRFDSFDQLRRQIELDCRAAREFFLTDDFNLKQQSKHP
ncbi:MAG: bifunctional riboflavin kinase/FAD synthetase [Gammaproteobacteria bacterium]|nr:bifunctional riboflavin kinase/FAD synthetase [Gammaproteobacteria bacterium]MCP5407115.1 bifunctional riboflavin kinase/FAD synthetase [Chromatiaceae bacterium]MCP5408327.1 bifunctional riboflavin kinase/FAD synthetase [Chromatiaceae bacterium]MCP5442141.1 bifunctional riboflavin kinase/FAD synthetase [Chromatiaceae bacterium]